MTDSASTLTIDGKVASIRSCSIKTIMATRQKIIIWLIFGLVVAAGLFCAFQNRVMIKDWWNGKAANDLPPAQSSENFNLNTVTDDNRNTNQTVNVNINNNTNTEPKALPAEINLKVPFTSQAPDANWDMPYQEACEEAAAIMIDAYWNKKASFTKPEADAAILDLVAFEEKNYGFYKDTNGIETVRFIKDKWGYKTVDLYTGSEVTIERIKREVANGYPVLVLTAGRMLGNPNYKAPGPIYHALVVKGYKKDGTIITNDPGTRKGADYVYAPEILLNAIHEWNNGDVNNGQKAMIVIRPKS